MTAGVKDYRLEVRVKNNHLLTLMAGARCESLSKLAERSGLSLNTISRYANLQSPLFNKWGKARPAAARLAEFFGCTVYELAPRQHWDDPLEKNRGSFEADLDEVTALAAGLREDPIRPDEMIEHQDLSAAISNALQTLTAREERVIRLRFALDGGREHTLDEVAELMDLTRERIRQIEYRARRKLKHPSRSRQLLLAAEGVTVDELAQQRARRFETHAPPLEAPEPPEPPPAAPSPEVEVHVPSRSRRHQASAADRRK